MNVARGKLVISRYRFLLYLFEKGDGPYNREPTSREAIEHVKGMLDKMDVFLVAAERGDQESWDKFNRWLGFCQGVFWMHEDYTLDQMREHNRT
jgi:hypothetical protein